MDEFLDDADKQIVAELIEPSAEFVRFCSWERVQLDGEFSLNDLLQLAAAMERMASRHAGGT